MRKAIEVLSAILAWRWLFELVFETLETAKNNLQKQVPERIDLTVPNGEGEEDEDEDEDEDKDENRPIPHAYARTA